MCLHYSRAKIASRLQIWLLVLCISSLISACQSPDENTAAGGADNTPFFQGHWSLSESFGSNQSTMTSWSFTPDGKVTRDGYPPVFAEARYKVKSLGENEAVLSLSNATGPQADWLTEDLKVSLNPENKTLTVNGKTGLVKQRE